jgi:outer membrane protein insertion porin family/translocation and assembly module TamA
MKDAGRALGAARARSRVTASSSARWTPVLGALFTASVVATTGCHSIPEGRSAIYSVEVKDVRARGAGPDMAEIEEKLATSPSPKFLGLFRGVVYEYTTFEHQTLQKDLARVEAACRAKGYFEARARAGRVHQTTNNHVRVEILVDPGEPVRVVSAEVAGVDDLPPALRSSARLAAHEALALGAPFDEAAYDGAKEALRRSLTDAGYAFAKVDARADVDLVRHRAFVRFAVEHGTPQKLGDVRVVGLGALPEDQVRYALSLEPGAPYSSKAIEEARQAVLELGVFASVEILPALEEGPRADGRVPLVVKLEPSRLRTVRVGGGVEFDALKTAVNATAGWEHRNFFGGLRKFHVDLTAGLVLYPLRVNNIEAPTDVFPEARLRFDTRQPGLFGGRVAGFFRPSVEVYPVLIDPNPPKDANVLGYGEARATLGIERVFKRVYGALSHNLQVAYPFSYLGPTDPTLSTVVISYPELQVQLDLRDSRVKPRKGLYAGSSFQVAGVGGDARDVKLQPELRGYVPVAKRVVLAARAGLGFLLPFNYGTAVFGNPDTLDEKTRTLDYQLVYFRGLFGGGPSSNRGYAARGISPYGNVGFLTPDSERLRQDSECQPDCRVPTGGFTLWEASVEVRVDVVGPLSAATFCDAGDVSPQRGDIRLAHLHLSCGLGARYQTPVGPIRLDVGYRLPGAQVLGGLTPDEKEPSTLAGAPIAIALGVGEAF